MGIRINVSKPYRPLYDAGVRNIIANCPRVSGKSFEIAQKITVAKAAYPRHDVVVFRANANSLLSSVCVEVLEKFEEPAYLPRRCPEAVYIYRAD